MICKNQLKHLQWNCLRNASTVPYVYSIPAFSKNERAS